MGFFPHSLTSHTMEWFSHLPSRIKSFDELTTKFVNHFPFNIEHDVTIMDLYKIKQSQGESFTSYLQRWRHKASRCKWPIPDKELVDIFVSNVQPEINYQLTMLFLTNFKETIEKGLHIERDIIASGVIKLNNPRENYSNSNEKPKIWAKNKNVTNHGVVDARVVWNMQNTNVSKENLKFQKLAMLPIMQKTINLAIPKTIKW